MLHLQNVDLFCMQNKSVLQGHLHFSVSPWLLYRQYKIYAILSMLLLGFKGMQLVNEAPTGKRKAEVSACVFRMVTSAFVFSLLKIIFS